MKRPRRPRRAAASDTEGGALLAASLRRLVHHGRLHWMPFIRQLSEVERRALNDHWPLWAHPGQMPGDGWPGRAWDVWLIRAGRGFGKTRAGAEWVHAYARANEKARIALVGGTADDVRQVMVEGPSGLVGRAAAGRVRRTVTTDLRGLAVAPGAIVAIAGEAGTWRVVETAWEAMAVRLLLAPVVAAPLPVRGATSGRVLGAPDERVGATLLRLVDLPAAEGTLPAMPRLGVVAAGEGSGWRRAALLWSVDDGASWTEAGETAAAGVVGVVEVAPPLAPATLVDRTGVLVVRLARADMVLGDADAEALDRGANLAAAGGELIQFGRAEPVGDGRWRLSELLRGRRGSEARAAAVGEGFALLDHDSVRVVDLPLSVLGSEVRVMASGVGDPSAVEARVMVDGLAVRPPSPAQLRAEPAAYGVVLRWARRSRVGWRWVDGVDAPLGEEAERYRISLIGADGSVREIESVVPSAPVGAAIWAATVRVEVRQRGTWAESRPGAMPGGERR